jgi:hypothetical protein
MAVQKLDKANEKNAALERENAELKKQIERPSNVQVGLPRNNKLVSTVR